MFNLPINWHFIRYFYFYFIAIYQSLIIAILCVYISIWFDAQVFVWICFVVWDLFSIIYGDRQRKGHDRKRFERSLLLSSVVSKHAHVKHECLCKNSNFVRLILHIRIHNRKTERKKLERQQCCWWIKY